MNLAVSLLVLIILVLLSPPVLGNMRISVNSRMARYQNGKSTSNQVSLYMLEQSDYYECAVLESLESDVEYMKDPKRRRGLLVAFGGVQRFQQQISKKALTDNVFTVSGPKEPDTIFWSAVTKNRYNAMTCVERDAYALVEQDLSSDGRVGRTLFVFDDEEYIVYDIDPAGKERREITMNSLPAVMTKEKLLMVAEDGKLGTKPKVWRDLTADDERLDLSLDE